MVLASLLGASTSPYDLSYMKMLDPVCRILDCIWIVTVAAEGKDN